MTAPAAVPDTLPPEVRAAVCAGYSVVPSDMSKRPSARWARWQTEHQTEQDIAGLGHGSLWGLVTGETYGLIVLDWDGPGGLADAERHGLPIHVRTSDGGHTYVRWPGFPVTSRSDKSLEGLPHLDIKGERSLAYFSGRSKKGKYAVGAAWPPAPLAFETLPDIVQDAVRACERPTYEPSAPNTFRTFTGSGAGTLAAVRYLDRAAADLRDADPGTSNSVLIQRGEGIGGLIAAGQLDEEHARQVWRAAAEERIENDPGERADRTIEHGLLRPWSDFGTDFEEDPGVAATRLQGNSSAGVRPLTDLGNAERLVDQHGVDIRRVREAGTWVVWQDGRWVRDEGAAHVRYLAQEAARAIHVEAAAEGLTNAEQRSISDWSLASQGAFRLRAMEEQARYRPEVAASRKDFDRQPFLVNFANGTLDLKTETFREHRRDDMLTKILPHPYDPNAQCPVWDAALKRALPDEEDRAYLQRALGTALIGQVPDRQFLLIYGDPGTGKSIVMEAVASVLGEYALKGKPEVLIQTRGHGSGPTPELAELEGRRLVYFSETEQHARMAVARLKDMTGSGMVNGRRNREDGGEFPLIATLVMDTNHVPAMGGDPGAWDRVQVLVFSHVVPVEERRDRHDLLDQLRQEGPGILNWLVEGARQYLASGLQPPESALRFRERLRGEEDLIPQFLAEACEVGDGPTFREEPARVFAAYQTWCEDNGFEGYQSQTPFWRDPAMRNFATAKSGGKRYRTGLRLRRPGASGLQAAA